MILELLLSVAFAKSDIVADTVKVREKVEVKESTTLQTPAAGNLNLYYDGSKLVSKDSSGFVSDFGGVPIIKNGKANDSTVGWATYADSGSRPIDGTGGSASITFTRTTSTPIEGAASFLFTKPAGSQQGQGASYDFTIDNGLKAKVLQVKLKYSIASGTYSGGTQSTDSDLIVYLYDVTNSKLIEPSIIKLDGGVNGQQYSYSSEFQTSFDSTSYRLIVHVASASTDAFTMLIDDVEVTQNVSSRGPPVTDWADYVPVAGLTNASWTGKWRRVGDSMEIQVAGVWAGAAGGSNLTISIPSGYSVDTTKVPNPSFLSDVNSSGNLFDSSASAFYDVKLGLNGNGVFVVHDSGTLGSYIGVTPTAPFTIASGDRFTGTFKVPIQGWGASQTLSQDGGTRVISFYRNNSGAASTTIGTGTTVITTLNQSLSDTTASWDSANNRYVVPEAGVYKIHGSVRAEVPAGIEMIVAIGVNSTWVDVGTAKNQVATTQILTATGTLQRWFNAGETISLMARVISGTAQAGQFNPTYLSIEKIQGPQQIAATETIAAFGTNTAGTSIPNNVWTNVPTPTIVDSSHGSLSTAGVFTAPAPGLYLVTANVVFVGNAAGTRLVRVMKNSLLETGIGQANHPTIAATLGVTATGYIRLKAGDNLRMQAYQTTGAALSLLTNGDVSTYLSVIRIGL